MNGAGLAQRYARVPPRLEGLRRAMVRIGLPAWFVAIDVLWLAKADVLGIDARLYQRAAAVWLGGGDPWKTTEAGIKYAAGPHTLIVYVPTSFLPVEVSVAFWLLVGLAASIWLVRRLGMPMWWLAFPPLVHSIWNGNPQTIALALLVYGGSSAGALAVIVKLYAAVPLFWRPRSLLIAGIFLAVTLPFLPWQLYLADGLGIGDHLSTAWNGSAWRDPILFLPPTLLGLWVLRRQGAEWLAVPAVWPATQFYYVAMAFPVVVKRPILAAALALPLPLLTPIAVIVMAVQSLWHDWRERRASTPAVPAPQT